MKFRRIFRWMFLVILVFLAGWLVRHYILYEQIHQAIKTSIRGIETEDISVALAYVSDDYHDELGFTCLDLRNMARQMFSGFEDIRVHIVSSRISRGGETADADLKVKVVATYGPQRGYLVGSPEDSQVLSLHFRLEPAGWRVIETRGILDGSHATVRTPSM